MKREYLIALGTVFIALLVWHFFTYRPSTKAPFLVKGNVNDLAAFLESNTVVVRVIYPFSDTQGPANAAIYLTSVFAAKGKRVILQYVEGNLCYTNEGNVHQAVKVDINRCLLPYPTFVIREGTGLIDIEGRTVYIYGDPSHLLPAASYVAGLIYPDADEVYREVMGRLERIKVPKS